MDKNNLINNIVNAKNAKRNAYKQYRNAKKTLRNAKKALRLYNQSAKNLAKMEKMSQFVEDMLEELTNEQ